MQNFAKFRSPLPVCLHKVLNLKIDMHLNLKNITAGKLISAYFRQELPLKVHKNENENIKPIKICHDVIL